MIRLEYTKPGQVLFGKIEENLEGRKFRPTYTVVTVDDSEKGLVTVKNEKGEMRQLEAKDLFTQAGIERYWREKYFTIYNLLKRVVDDASPSLRKDLNDKLTR